MVVIGPMYLQDTTFANLSCQNIASYISFIYFLGGRNDICLGFFFGGGVRVFNCL